jgi:hypothetical protein
MAPSASLSIPRSQPGIRSWRRIGLLWFLLPLLACGGGKRPAPLSAVLVPPDTALPAPGSRVVFQVAVLGGDQPRIQWLKDGQPIAGATGAWYALGPVGFADAGEYQAQVSDGAAVLLTAPWDLEPADDPWLVTSAADDGPGSLRQTLAAANAYPGVNGIAFDLPGPGPYRIVLASDLPPVTGTVTVLGPPDGSLTLDGGGAHRPWLVNGGTLVLDHFTVANGLGKGGDSVGGGGGAGMGGALFINQGAVTLRRMVFQGNRAVGGSSAPGLDGQGGGGGGFGGDAPAAGGSGASGGFLGGVGGQGQLDGAQDGGPATGLGAGGGAAAGATGLLGGDGEWGGGGGFSVGPDGGGGNGSAFGGGGGSGGVVNGAVLAGGSISLGGAFGGGGGQGDGVTPGQGGGGAGLGGAVFLRAGSLAMARCSFLDNHALPGAGANPGQGKGGALFIYEFNPANGPFNLALLQAQQYQGNSATDLADNPGWDNNDYYVAQGPLANAVRRPSGGRSR